ncbi:hypothetical protein VTN96DRAFT_8353 [Rasamsonia emersonii]|uniref:Uncharacterized protein n=1 Tax=Rasamsonia emersonii (strain ATCC 16479 / CBS 393.64 / IMI 116815) TaxID=1408163 RepID=A0A0F4YYJ8_RASE3|nr:hypothetical protein T310_3028 [Rasamsonia emersonii CBS 393.64]KKA22921.1 hypothetical protein T310_3028 [Rasamsonia emersonii CBS 393.64]
MAGECATVPCNLDGSGKLATGALENRLEPPLQSNTGDSQQRIDQLISAKRDPVPGDPNLDPFYLERSLEDSKAWACRTVDDTDVELEDLEIEYFMSYMAEDRKQLSVGRQGHPVHIQCDSYHAPSARAPVYAAPAPWQRTPVHHSQSSCSSIRTDATGLTPDLTPSSSFSSTYSVPNCPEAVRKATEQLALHSDQVRRERSDSTARFYLPAATPPSQSRACTRPPTPVDRTASATPQGEPINLSTETLTMIPKDQSAPAASSLRSKPLPNIPPLTRNPSGPAARKKAHSQGSRGQIDPSQISPPSLINPVTMEPHASHFDHALFIPAHDCPSPVPNPTAPSPPITRQITSASSKERPSTSTSVAYGEQSVWESDSDTESIMGKSQSRRGPIETLRKVRSRVQLRRIAKSEGKLQADIRGTSPEQDDPTPKLPQQPYVAPEAAGSATSIADVLPATAKQTLRLVAPSTTSLPRPQSRHSNEEKGDYEINTSAAAAVQAQSRRRQRSNADETVPFSKEETSDRYYPGRQGLPRVESNPDAVLSLDRSSVFKRVWRSLRALSCRSER